MEAFFQESPAGVGMGTLPIILVKGFKRYESFCLGQRSIMLQYVQYQAVSASMTYVYFPAPWSRDMFGVLKSRWP